MNEEEIASPAAAMASPAPMTMTAQTENALVAEVKRLNTSILTMRSMVNELITSHNELKDQMSKMQHTNVVATMEALPTIPSVNDGVLAALQHREGHHSKVPIKKERNTEIINGTKTCHADAFKTLFTSIYTPEELETTDEEIDEIISRRKQAGEWPIRQKTYLAFSTNLELLKIRFHHSQKYNHVPVRINDTKGKDNRSRCKLCMSYNKKASKGAGRNTSWMCSTCEVPLCVKCLIGEESDVRRTHHARWHLVRDLASENMMCCEEVNNSRKRKAGSSLDAELGEGLADEVDRIVNQESI
jgi:hypothetical protein